MGEQSNRSSLQRIAHPTNHTGELSASFRGDYGEENRRIGGETGMKRGRKGGALGALFRTENGPVNEQPEVRPPLAPSTSTITSFSTNPPVPNPPRSTRNPIQPVSYLARKAQPGTLNFFGAPSMTHTRAFASPLLAAALFLGCAPKQTTTLENPPPEPNPQPQLATDVRQRVQQVNDLAKQSADNTAKQATEISR